MPVGHVEAGLRSHDFMNPFPEEANRRLTDALSALHFAPTGLARQKLLNENLPAERIFVTGNSGIDALKMAVERIERGCFTPSHSLQALAETPFVLITAHRRENFGQPLENIGNKTTYEWVFNWVRDPKHYNPGTYMPNLRLTDQQAADIATYLMTLKQTGGDAAKATFTDGVLEIRMPAPPEQVTRGRRLEIKEGTEPKK